MASKWTTGVNEYAEELKEFLAENNLEATEKNMLDGYINTLILEG